MTSFDFEHIGNTSQHFIIKNMDGSAFELTALLSYDVVPNSKEVTAFINKVAGETLFFSREFYAPNQAKYIIPDAAGDVNVKLTDPNTGQTITIPWIDSAFVEVKTTPRIDLDQQQISYIDYLANYSPASILGTPANGDPIPTLIYFTTAETRISSNLIDAANNPGSLRLLRPNLIGRAKPVAIFQVVSCLPTKEEMKKGKDLIMSRPFPINSIASSAPSNTLPFRTARLVKIPWFFLRDVTKKNTDRGLLDLPTLDTTQILLEIRRTLPDELPPSPPEPGLCFITSSFNGFEYGPCPVSANPSEPDEANSIGWGFGIGSDYLL